MTVPFICFYSSNKGKQLSIPYNIKCSRKHDETLRPKTYRQTSNIRRTLVGNKNVHHKDVVGASSVSAALTASSLST